MYLLYQYFQKYKILLREIRGLNKLRSILYLWFRRLNIFLKRNFYWLIYTQFIYWMHESSLPLLGFLQLQQGGLLEFGLRPSTCAGFSCWQARAPEHVGSGNSCVSSSGAGAPDPGSLVVTCGLRCSIARGILPDQRSNPCPLHLQADSQPLNDQGSPLNTFNASIPPKLSIY